MNFNTKLFERELNFSDVYKENLKEDKAIREARCMEVQLNGIFDKLKEEDLFVGRYKSTAIGFFPLMIGGGVLDGFDKTCYSVDFKRCYEILEIIKRNESYGVDYENKVLEAIKFWKKENTHHKIREAFDYDMKKGLTEDEYGIAIGAAYPLYRIAGAHLDYKKLLKYGLVGLIEIIEAKKIENSKSEFIYDGMIIVLEALRNVCKGYLEYIEEKINQCSEFEKINNYKRIRSSLINIKDKKPETLHEAIQLLNIYAIGAGATELGRIDDYLGNFYIRDINNGIITKEEAIAYVDSFFKLMAENLCRDTRAIIGGYGRENENNADEFSLIILEVIERRFMTYPQVSLRYYKGMDERVYEKALDILGMGRTFPILYNDDVNVEAVMSSMEVPKKVAEQYGFFGCGEYMISNKSIGTPNTLINMPKILEVTLNNGVDPITKKEIGLKTGNITDNVSFDELFNRYTKQADFFIDQCGKLQELVYKKCGEESEFLLLSILYDDCIERGKGIFNGGIYHLGGTLETYGNITVSDSFTAIKKLVYEDKKITLTKLIKIIECNFNGYEDERKMLINVEKYGNDYERADYMAVKVHDHICNSIRNQRKKRDLDSFLVVMINNNMNVLLGKSTGATADGRVCGEFLSNGNGAYSGMDKEGITALINSLVKLDTKIHAGANHNLKFSSELFNENRDKLKCLLQTFFEMGGQQTNLSVVNQKDLEDAIVNPEKHENLIVRVGGFTARFIELDKDTQLEIIKRTAY